MKLKWSKEIYFLNWNEAFKQVKFYFENIDQSDKGLWRLPNEVELKEYGKSISDTDKAYWTCYEGKSSSIVYFIKDDSSSFLHKQEVRPTVFIRDVLQENQREPYWEIKDVLQVQEKSALSDDYNLGLYNGMELCLSILEKREPKFKDLNPKKILNRYRIDVLQNSNKEITGMKYELEETGNWIQYSDIQNLVERQEYIISELRKLLK
jgi:hypothetical protein